MPRFEDWGSSPEVRDIVEQYVQKFPYIFEGFKVDDIFFIMTKVKRVRGKFPIRAKAIPYPYNIAMGQTYVFETFETKWEDYNQKQKNLSVFHAMCAIPIGGFDPLSAYYGKMVKPDFEIYRYEYAVSGGIPDWQENNDARDPMELEQADVPLIREDGDEDPIPAVTNSPKTPATADMIASSIMEKEAVTA
jgi:hypothetical protein